MSEPFLVNLAQLDYYSLLILRCVFRLIELHFCSNTKRLSRCFTLIFLSAVAFAFAK